MAGFRNCRGRYTKLTWDNAALIAPATARRLGLANEQVVELTTSVGQVRAPVWVLPGHAPDCVTLPFGFGRSVAGRVGKGVGFDAFRVRPMASPWQVAGAGPAADRTAYRPRHDPAPPDDRIR